MKFVSAVPVVKDLSPLLLSLLKQWECMEVNMSARPKVKDLKQGEEKARLKLL